MPQQAESPRWFRFVPACRRVPIHPFGQGAAEDVGDESMAGRVGVQVVALKQPPFLFFEQGSQIHQGDPRGPAMPTHSML